MGKVRLGILRKVEDINWDEYCISVSTQDVEKISRAAYNGWTKINIKKRKEPKDDKIGYGEIFVPDSKMSENGFTPEGQLMDGYDGSSPAEDALPPLDAGSEVKEEDIPQEPDLTQDADLLDDDNLPL